jgi:hypothetical protein
VRPVRPKPGTAPDIIPVKVVSVAIVVKIVVAVVTVLTAVDEHLDSGCSDEQKDRKSGAIRSDAYDVSEQTFAELVITPAAAATTKQESEKSDLNMIL